MTKAIGVCLRFSFGNILSSYLADVNAFVFACADCHSVWLPAAPILAQWFSKKRSLAQGIASSGSGIVGVIFSVSTTYMIDNLGLRWALRIIGLTSTVMLLVGTALIRDRNKNIKPEVHPFSTRLLKKKGVWLLMGFSATTVLAYIVVIYSFSAFAISIGLTQQQGGVAVALMNAGTAVVRPLMGILSDKCGRISTAFAITFLDSILAFAFWIPINSYATLLVFAFVIGGTGGVYWVSTSLDIDVFQDLYAP